MMHAVEGKLSVAVNIKSWEMYKNSDNTPPSVKKTVKHQNLVDGTTCSEALHLYFGPRHSSMTYNLADQVNIIKMITGG
jgi:hypothetical protein